MDRYSLFFQISVFSNKSLRLAYWTEKNYANCSCFQSNPIFLRQIKVPFLYSYLNRRIRQWQQIFEILDGLPGLFLRGVGDASYSSNHEGGSTGRGPKRKNSEKKSAKSAWKKTSQEKSVYICEICGTFSKLRGYLHRPNRSPLRKSVINRLRRNTSE